MRADEVCFAVVEVDVAVLQIRAPLAQRLHFGTCECDACLDFLQDEVVVKCLPVRGDQFLGGFGLRGHGSGDCTRRPKRARRLLQSSTCQRRRRISCTLSARVRSASRSSDFSTSSKSAGALTRSLSTSERPPPATEPKSIS